MRALVCEIRFREPVLAAAVPEIEHEISHEPDVAVFDVDGSPETPHVFCDVVAEDYAAHAGFARAGFAH